MEEIKVLGIDLAKHVFEVCGMTLKGEVLLRRQMSRKELAIFMATAQKCLVAMEACGSSNYWGREFRGMGVLVQYF
jgi:transposase